MNEFLVDPTSSVDAVIDLIESRGWSWSVCCATNLGYIGEILGKGRSMSDPNCRCIGPTAAKALFGAFRDVAEREDAREREGTSTRDVVQVDGREGGMFSVWAAAMKAREARDRNRSEMVATLWFRAMEAVRDAASTGATRAVVGLGNALERAVCREDTVPRLARLGYELTVDFTTLGHHYLVIAWSHAAPVTVEGEAG